MSSDFNSTNSCSCCELSIFQVFFKWCLLCFPCEYRRRRDPRGGHGGPDRWLREGGGRSGDHAQIITITTSIIEILKHDMNPFTNLLRIIQNTRKTL